MVILFMIITYLESLYAYSGCTCHLMSRSSKVTCRSVSYSLYPPLGSCTNSNSSLSKRSSKASVLYICSAAIKFYNNIDVNHMQQVNAAILI